VIEELQPLRDLRHDVLHDQFASRIQFQVAQARQELRWRAAEKVGQGERAGFSIFNSRFSIGEERQLHGAAHAIEPGAAAIRTRLAALGDVIGGFHAELAQPLRRIVLILVVGLEHPGKDASVPAARRAPAARRVERKVLRIELGKRLARLDVGPRCRKPREDGAALSQEETGALAHPKRSFKRFGRRGQRSEASGQR